MNAIEVTNLEKSFGNTHAVDAVTFTVERGEIFGLLGPNGAGKTTMIRMMLDIFKPDSGNISILGGSFTEAKKTRIGYLPEERGLYQDIPLEHCLLYLAMLKGLPESEARQRLKILLERFDLAKDRGKKVKELSKGMQQKAQLISTILHQPELIILDEPFAGLDPLNVQLVKDLMDELHQQGVTILMSTHQMHLVEELCNRILLIHHGRSVLYGNLAQIQRSFSGNAVLIHAQGEIPKLPGVREILPQNQGFKITLADCTQPQDIFKALASSNLVIEKFEIAIPTLDEIFIRVVEGGENNA